MSHTNDHTDPKAVINISKAITLSLKTTSLLYIVLTVNRHSRIFAPTATAIA